MINSFAQADVLYFNNDGRVTERIDRSDKTGYNHSASMEINIVSVEYINILAL